MSNESLSVAIDPATRSDRVSLHFGWSEAGDRTVCRGVIVREHFVTVCATSLRSCEPELEIDRSNQSENRSNRHVSMNARADERSRVLTRGVEARVVSPLSQ
jgi:hypothetical protein